jgi:hypothetical protein
LAQLAARHDGQPKVAPNSNLKAGLSMKAACVALLVLAALFAACGLFGAADSLKRKPGGTAAVKAAYQTVHPTDLPKAYKDYVEGLERGRDVGLAASLVSLGVGMGLALWAGHKLLGDG